MSKQKIFDDIMNEFNSDEEEEMEENEYIGNDNKNTKHKSNFSLTENTKDKIKDRLSNEYAEEEEQSSQKKKTKRDRFGYFISDDNNENEESEDSNLNNEEQENDKYNEYTELEKNESMSNQQKEDINKKDEEEKQNDVYDNEKNSQNPNEEAEGNINDNNIDNKDKDKDKNNNEDEDKVDIYEKICNEKEEENDLINELYENNNDIHDKLDQNEGEDLRMHSFRPNPIPSSPKFTKRISVANSNSNTNSSNFYKEEMKTNSNNINNNMTNNNNFNVISRLSNFTETINPKIINDNPMKNSIKENPINSTIYTHNNNIVSLGKMSINNKNLDSTQMNNLNSINDKLNDEEAKEEEAFLKSEEQKVNTKNNEIKNIEKITEEDGKENVTDEEEENGQIQQLNNLEIKERIDSTNNGKDKTNIKNDVNDMKVKGMPIKLQPKEKYGQEGERPSNNVYSGKKNSNDNNNNDNVYFKKITSNRNTNKKNMNNQNIIIKKNLNYNSPSTRNTKYNNTNSNSSEGNQVISSIKKNTITSFKVNSNYSYFSNNSNKNMFKNKADLQSIKKNLYYPKHEIKSKLYEPPIKRNTNYVPEKYSFLPEINERSREICSKMSKNRSTTPDLSSKNGNNYENTSYISSRSPDTPIGNLLYEDAYNKKQKINRMYFNEINNIKSAAIKKKINNNSYSMVIERINKKIDNAVKKFSSNGKMSILGFAKCLFDLNIINEIIKIKDNINDDFDFDKLQSVIKNINEKDVKKLEEVELLEQLWFKINPSLAQCVNSEILSELLKILFSSNNNIRKLSNDISILLKKYNLSYNDDKDEKNCYMSPLRKKNYNKNEIWEIEKFIKIFINLKKNLKAYRENDYQKGEIYNNIKKERDKDLTFKPELTSNDYFYKYSNYDYDRDNSIDSSYKTNNNTSKKIRQDKIYERFMEHQRRQEKALERIRQIKQEKELKMCTNVPKINKYILKGNRSPKEKTLRKSKSSLGEKKVPRYQKLYNMRKLSADENKSKEDENCTFKPVLTTNNDILNKIFSKKSRNPRGYEDYIERNRSVIQEKEYQKKLQEDKKYGKNYERIHNMKIKPFNITDLSENKKKKKINDISREQSSNEFGNNSEKEKVQNIIDDIYITIEVKIPNGQLKPLKIYNKNYNDTVELVNNFCKIYSINNENRKIIIKKVLQYKNSFFGRNLIEERSNRDGFLLNEDLDTITNTYSNNSNH